MIKRGLGYLNCFTCVKWASIVMFCKHHRRWPDITFTQSDCLTVQQWPGSCANTLCRESAASWLQQTCRSINITHGGKHNLLHSSTAISTGRTAERSTQEGHRDSTTQHAMCLNSDKWNKSSRNRLLNFWSSYRGWTTANFRSTWSTSKLFVYTLLTACVFSLRRTLRHLSNTNEDSVSKLCIEP